MGRRLAEERSKNHRLTQRINELESLSRKGGKATAMNGHNFSPDRGFSSPPVSTPAKGFRIDDSLAADATTFEIRGDASNVKQLLVRASKLLSEDRPRTRSGSTGTKQRMQDYLELVTEFHREQESITDIDGDELFSHEDFLWLLHELKWRFEEINQSYVEDRSSIQEESDEELKECLGGLADIVKKAMKRPPSSHGKTGSQRDRQHIYNSSQTNGTHHSQNDVNKLNRRLASFAMHHTETCGSLQDDMEAMKRAYEDQITSKNASIQKLESRLTEQNEYLSQEKHWIHEEKQKLSMNKEGTAVRIRYLEGMLRSLQEELKESGLSKKNDKNSTPNRADGQGIDKGGQPLSPPVFLRDLAYSDNTTVDGRDWGGTPQDEIIKLQDRISSLGNSLADSETKRANLLDLFQQERKKYILQYKQMSDVLKQLLLEEKRNDA